MPARPGGGGGGGQSGGPGNPAGAPPPERPQVAIVSSSLRELVATIRFPEPTVVPVTYRGRQVVDVRMAGCQPLKEVDQPALPVQRWDAILPLDAAARVEVVSVDAYTVPSSPPIPSGGFSSRRQQRAEGDFGSVYDSNEPFPSELAELSAPYQIRTLRGTGVILHPVRYLPAEKALQVVRSVQVRLHFSVDTDGATLRYPAKPDSRAFRELGAARFANYQQTVGTSAATATTRADGGFTGTDVLLLVVPDAWDGQFGDFIEWKRQRGLTVLTARYPTDTGEGAAALASYLQGAYDNSQVAYVILMGDESAIPYSYGYSLDYSNNTRTTPSDTVYTLVAGDDNYQDILISRVCTPALGEASALLAKAMAYERTPNTAPDWHAAGMMVASNILDSSYDTAYDGHTDAEHLASFGTDLVNSGLFNSIDHVTEGTPEGTTAKISTYWNAGRGLVYYLGHGSATSWSSVSFGTSNAYALSNGTMLPFVINGACDNGAFQENDPCLAEAMLWGSTRTADNGQGGAIVVIAATTNMDWDPPIAMLDAFTGYYLGQSSFQVGSFLTVNDQPRLWDAGSLAFASIQRAMDYCTSATGLGEQELKLIMQQTHLFGDGTLGVRTAVPRTLAVSHVGVVHPVTGLDVNVTDGTRGAVAGATVTLTDASGHQSVATTDASGDATVAGTAFASGALVTLTVYERDSVPVQETGILVGDGTVVITSDATPPAGFTGETYSHTFSAVSGTAPYSWSVSAGSLPDGMALSATGEFSGTPTAGGNYGFTVRVTDSSAVPQTDDLAVTWAVGSPVQITAQNLPDGTVGSAYSEVVSATGTFTPFTYTVATRGVPDGLSFGSDGTLAGTPGRQGEYVFTVRVTDSQGRTDQAEVSVTVLPAATVTITTTSLPEGTVGLPYSQTLDANGGSGGGYVWGLASGSLPSGLSLGTDGTIAGTPASPVVATFTVQVTDDANEPRTDTQELTLTISQPVVLTESPALPTAVQNAPYSHQIAAVGGYTPFTFATANGDYAQNTATNSFAEGGTLQENWYGDEALHTLDLGFAFPYFGQTYTSCTVSDNGYLVFGDTIPTAGDAGDSWNALPSRLGSYRMVAPFWTDLIIESYYAGTGIWVEQNGTDITIRWCGYDYWNDPVLATDPPLINFSVALHAAGQIEFRYGSLMTTNRVVIGLGDAGDHDSVLVYSQDNDGSATAEQYSDSPDLVFLPKGALPPGISLSSGGVLSGTPTAAGTYTFAITVTDTDANVDGALFTLQVQTDTPDTNSDGDVSNDEILAYIERYHAAEVSEQDVTNAVALWRAGPPASRSATRSRAIEPRSRVRVAYGSRAMLDRIIDRGLDIASVHDGEAWIHAASAERAWLEAQGLVCVDAPRSTPRAGTTFTYDELAAHLQTLATTHPGICRITQIGTSVEGRALLALVLSDHPYVAEDEPEVRISGGIHGDERLGVGLPVRLAEWLLANYGGEDADGVRATNLLDTTELWIVPLLNPDGYEAGNRENANGQDLNRYFPDGFEDGVSTVYAEGAPDTSSQQMEQAAMMEWTAARRFALGANLHTGVLLTCYPYGNNAAGTTQYSASPDDALFVELARSYANNHATMATGGTFPNGIINSCEWYRVVGEFADWAYRYTGSLEITVELSPDGDADLDAGWADNMEALLAFSESAQQGIRGVVRDARTGTPLRAVVGIAGNGRQVFTDPTVGDYHRVLLPGTYDVTVSSSGYLSQTFAGVVVNDTTRLDVDLVATLGAHRTTRSFPSLLYTPEALNTVALSVDLDEADLPNAFIVSEVLPDGWSYATDSATETGAGTPLGTPRVEGATVSWLFWQRLPVARGHRQPLRAATVGGMESGLGSHHPLRPGTGRGVRRQIRHPALAVECRPAALPDSDRHRGQGRVLALHTDSLHGHRRRRGTHRRRARFPHGLEPLRPGCRPQPAQRRILGQRYP
jgi:carboxypeptidase D